MRFHSWDGGVSSCFRAVLLGTALIIPGSVAAQGVSLTEAVELALSTNPDIGIVASNREAVDEELRQARGLWLPQIDVAAGIGKERTEDRATRADPNNKPDLTLTRKEASVTLQQRIFDGFEADSTIAREKARVQSAARRVAENSEFLGLDAIGVYLEVLRQRELVRLAEENLGIHLTILDAVRQRLAGGGGSRADVVQTEARAARARATLTQTLNDLRDAEATYTRIIGQFPDELRAVEFPKGILPSDLDAAVSLAGSNNPTTRIFEADVKTAVAEVSLSEAPFFPAITLEAESEYNDNRDGIEDDEFNNQVMVRLRWNLFRGGIDRAARQEALSRLAESKNRRMRSFLEAQREMRQSWFALEASRQRVEDLSDAVRFNMETRDAYRQQFEVAQRTLLDVLDAENELFVSSGQLVTAQTNELLASYRILAVGGMLLDTLDIRPPEQAVVENKTWLEGLGVDR
ncbi:MAG: TolC family outer membrane protein [Kiloniellaceae bacterium]